MAQFRCGILPIRIETGRFRNIKDEESGKARKLKPEERLCLICQSGEIENKLHFLCFCPKYNYLREILFSKMQNITENFLSMRSEEKFKFMMIKGWRDVANFLNDAWGVRKSMLYT